MDLDLRSMAAALAQVVGVPPEQVPVPDAGSDPTAVWREWLAVRNLGLVPVRDPAAFTWPGHFLAVISSGDSGRGVVMFGVPPGVVHDPAGGGSGEVERAWVVAPLDRSLADAEPYGVPPGTVGRVEAIALAPAAAQEAREVQRAQAVPGKGLEGDRYAAGEGTFSGGSGDGRALTLVEAEVLASVGLEATEARRNLVTRGVWLNALVGRRFTVGDVECEGRRLCEPCAHLERLTEPGMLRALVHRGGLRADILSAGTIEVGAAVRVLG